MPIRAAAAAAPGTPRGRLPPRAFLLFLGMVMAVLLLLPPPVRADANPIDDNDDEDTDHLQEVYDPKPLGNYKFEHKTVLIPHDDKKFRGGEDAASTIDDMIVVADGVGGWANRGVNPGLYSRLLTETITSSYSKLEGHERHLVDLKKLVHESNHAAASEHLGSATCTVVRLMDGQTLETLNIGDSGYSIHRKQNRVKKDAHPHQLKVSYASVPGQKGFNFPHQLGGKHGDQVDDEGVCDGPRRHKISGMDILVVVSDGVSDNIDPHRYNNCLNQYQYFSDRVSDDLRLYVEEFLPHLRDGTLVSKSAAADCIARTAYFLGKDPHHSGPFARSAKKYGKRYLGGKHDDITVTVAQVVVADSKEGPTPGLPDPHRADAIFVYKDQDGPVQPVLALPTLEELLKDPIMKAATAKAEQQPVGVGDEL